MRMTHLKSLAFCFLAGIVTVPALAQPRSSQVPTDQVLMIYGQLSGRTILRPGRLPPVPDSVVSQIPKDANAAIAFIESELAKSDIEVIREGELFVRVLPANWANSPVGPHLARLRQPSSEKTSDGEIVPAGMMDFRGMPVERFIQIYSEFRNRTILSSPRMPMTFLTFRSQTPLSRQDIIYGLNVVLVLNGLVPTDDGEKFVQIIPVDRAGDVQALAPKPEKDEVLIPLEKVPSFLPGAGFRGNSGAEAVPPTVPVADSLVAYYAELTGCKAVSAEKVGGMPIRFRVNTPLTKGELLYAIEATLALDGLTIVPGEGNSVRAGRRVDR